MNIYMIKFGLVHQIKETVYLFVKIVTRDKLSAVKHLSGIRKFFIENKISKTFLD